MAITITEQSICKIMYGLLGIILLLISLTAFNPFLFVLAFGFFCCFIKRTDSLVSIFAVLFLSFSLLLIYLNWKQYTFIPQAKILLDWDTNIFVWFKNGHVHAIRLLIAYPGYLISKLFEIQLNIGFSYYICLVFFLIFRNVLICTKKVSRKKCGIITILGCFIVIVCISAVMNGRIVFAFYGFSNLILYMLLLYNSEKRISVILVLKMLIFGILPTAVSSGTLLLAIAYLGASLFLKYKKTLKIRKTWFYILMCIVLLSPVWIKGINYIFAMINKNLMYFGGGFKGFYGMLQHGLGAVFQQDFIIVSFLIIIGVLFIMINFLFLRKMIRIKTPTLPVILSGNISVYGILFGYSTGTTILVAILIGILVFFNKIIGTSAAHIKSV